MYNKMEDDRSSRYYDSIDFATQYFLGICTFGNDDPRFCEQFAADFYYECRVKGIINYGKRITEFYKEHKANREQFSEIIKRIWF